MYAGYNNSLMPMPVPAPVPAGPAAVVSPSPVLAAPHVAAPPVPLPVPAFSALPSPSPYVPVVPRPAAAPTLAVPPAVPPAPRQATYAFAIPVPVLSIPAVAPPASTTPLPMPSVALRGSSSPPVAATAAQIVPAPWLQSTTPSPPPLTAVLNASPHPQSGRAARPSITRMVTFALPGERTEVPAAAVPVVTAPPSITLTGSQPLHSALRVPAPSAAPVVVPTLPVPSSAPSPAAPALRTANTHYMQTATTPPVATPTLPSLPPATSSLLALRVPSVPTAVSLPLPSGLLPQAATAATGGSAVPSLHPALAAPPASWTLAVPTLPMPAVVSRPLAAPLPTLRATEEEAPATPPPPPVAEEEELKIPDYSKWLYPALLSTAAAPKPEMKFPLAETKTPHMLPPAILLQWCEADVLASLPLTLPPEYVIFGGARYSGAPLDLLRPPFVPQVSFEKTSAYYESAEAQRLQFLLDQLDVAKNYLKIEVKRMAEVRHVASTPPPPVDPVPSASRSGEDVLLKHGEEEDLSKATVWTTAYFGSPQQLNRVLTSKNADGVLSSAGYVQYHRRQWGLKRTGDTFVLGLGMKATALQFAAAAGKLDNVVLLLTKGAKDNASPPLKEILLKESMVMITAICAPRVRPPRVRRPVATEETYMQDTHAGTTSTFVKEQVVSIDDAAYPHAGAVSYHATAFS